MKLLVVHGPLPEEACEWYRASKDCECPDCGLEFWRHPFDFWELDYAGEPFMHVLCNGDRVKL
jgi:hypothetical protein